MNFRIVERQGAYFVELPSEFVKAQGYEAGDTLIASSYDGFKLVKKQRPSAEQRVLIDRLIDQYRGTLSALTKT
jgi:hypothetical protein